MAAGETLILEVRDFIDLQHWRWILKDSQGKFLADHEVDLDPADPNYSTFTDLEGFLKANSSPDRWLEDHIRLMQQSGQAKVFRAARRFKDRSLKRNVQ